MTCAGVTVVRAKPCTNTVLGGCLPNPTQPERCLYCDRVVDHARTRLEHEIARADRQLLDRIGEDLRRDALITDALHRLAVLIRRARRPWWRG